MKFHLKLFSLIILSIFFCNVAEAQKSKPDKEFENFWNDFKTAVKNNDKEKILSMTNFPFFRYDEVFQSVDKFTKQEFFKIDKKNYFYGPGLSFIDSKNKDRVKLMKINSYRSFIPEHEADVDFNNALPELKEYTLIEVSLNNKSYGLSSLIFRKINNSYLLIGDKGATNDNEE